MKFTLSFKTPDVCDQIEEEIEDPAVKAIVEKYLRFGEYITIVFDTEDGSATVEPVS